jgi:hypothetical protein
LRLAQGELGINPRAQGELGINPRAQGGGNHGYDLHAVIIKKDVPLEEAKKEAQKIIKNNNRKYFRETGKTYRFRNISKQKFDPSSFRTQIINKNLSLVYGKQK